MNPQHLEAVTQQENIRRGEGASARNARKTHCLHGHPFEGDNLSIDCLGRRVCITCRRAKDRRLKEKKRAQRATA